MQIVYQLKNDSQRIALIQKATLTTEKFGLEPTHGLFGGAVWWANLVSGKLRIHTLRGTIERVYMGSMNDWPECTVVADDGSRSDWTREGHSPSMDRFYRVGAKIEIDYVEQQSRLTGWGAGAMDKNVVEIRIEAL